MTHFGRVALAGAPNVGKSTLLNQLIGSPLSIVSPKAQATRTPVVGLLTRGETQVVLHDLPGLLMPRYLLQRRMVAAAAEVLERVDVVLYLHPASQTPAPELGSLIQVETAIRAPVRMVFTKADLVSPARRRELDSAGLTVAESDAGLPERLLHFLEPDLPEKPFEYDPDDLGTQPVRFFVTEYVREAAFALLEDELPYAVAAEVEEFREGATPVYIRVSVFVERESQKGIVLGKGGRTIKAIGAHARARMEELLGEQVYLDLWVKVLPRWRKHGASLERLGFPASDGESQ